MTTVEYPDGVSLPAVPYGPDAERPCHDCLTPPGGYHQPGCDAERCPRCGGQLIACSCLSPGEDDA